MPSRKPRPSRFGKKAIILITSTLCVVLAGAILWLTPGTSIDRSASIDAVHTSPTDTEQAQPVEYDEVAASTAPSQEQRRESASTHDQDMTPEEKFAEVGLPDPAFSTDVVIESRELPHRSPEHVRRVKVVKTDFKYPYLRVAETIRRHPKTGNEITLERLTMVADHVMVKVNEGIDADALEQIAEKYNGTIIKKMLAPNLYIVQLEKPSIDAVESAVAAFEHEVASISYAEPDYVGSVNQVIPNDSQFGDLWGMNNTGQTGGAPDADIDAPEAWDIYTGYDNVLVGILDTGMDYNHPDLVPNLWANPGETGLDGQGQDKRTNGIDDDGNGFVDDHRGWDFYNDDNDPMDDNFHGTHVAGTIGGAGNNSLGIAGVSWGASIVSLKIGSASGSIPWSDAIDACYYATSIGVKLTSNSWGGGGYSQGMLDAVNDAAANDILFVAGAGNYGYDNDEFPFYPASFPSENIIAVAATDHNDEKPWWSHFGQTSVDLAAPGVAILSTFPTYQTVAMGQNGFSTDYESIDGTSMATPHVAGVAALLWSQNPSRPYSDVRSAILESVDAVPALDEYVATGGRLNAHKALLAVGLTPEAIDPLAGSIVSMPPVDFTIRFNKDIHPASVLSHELKVNGISSSSRTIVDPQTITFHYSVSPVSSEGEQTMTMAYGAAVNVEYGLLSYPLNATFRYDATPLNVFATIPLDGSVVVLPWASLYLHFSEPYDPASIDVNDLVLSRGSVAGYTFIDSDTVEYTLTGMSLDTEPVSIALPAGAITDAHGNPSEAFAGSYILVDDPIGPWNLPPVVDAGPDQAWQVGSPVPPSGVTFSLDGSVNDDGMGPLSYQWSVASGPGLVTFGSPNYMDTSATFVKPGTYELKLEVNDDGVWLIADTVTFTLEPTVTLPDAIAEWRFDEGSGGYVKDWAPSPPIYPFGLNSLILRAGSSTFNEGPTWTDGHVGSGMKVWGNTWLQVAFPGIDLGSESTVSVWFKMPLDAGAAGWNTLLQGLSSDFPALVQRSTGLLGFYDWTSGSSVGGFYSSGFNMYTLADGWHHMAVVGAIGNTKYYIDGTHVGTAPLQSYSDILAIGNNHITFNQPFGTIDEMMVFNEALDSLEIQVLATEPPVNRAPVADAGQDHVVVGEVTYVGTLDGSIMDDGLGTVTTEWSLLFGDGTVSFADPTDLSTTVTYSDEGFYVLQLTATDNGDIVVSDQVEVTVFERVQLSDGPIAEWYLDGDLIDESGNEYDAAFYGQPQWVEGYWNEGINTVPNSYLNVGSVPLGIESTLTTWFKMPLNPSASVWNTLFQGNTQVPALVEQATGELGFYGWGSPYPSGFVSSGFDMNTLEDGWHHLALIGSGGYTHYYIDGLQVGTVTRQSQSDIRSIGGSWSTLSQPFGTIDEVAIYDVALDPAGIATLATLVPSPNRPPLVDAGADQMVLGIVTYTTQLEGMIDDDGLGPLAIAWSVVSGPGTVSFVDESDPETAVSFSDLGEYVLKLEVDDNNGEFLRSDTVTISVAEDEGMPNPIAEWSLEGNTLDNMGQYDGSLVGSSLWWVGGYIDTSLYVGQASYLDVGSVPLGTESTISLWFKMPLASGANGWNTLLVGSYADVPAIVQRSTGYLGFYGWQNASHPTGFASTGFNIFSLGDGWHHLAIVSANGNTQYYINGTIVATLQGWQSTSDIRSIGNNWTYPYQQWGYLDEVSIFDQALTPTQIQILANE